MKNIVLVILCYFLVAFIIFGYEVSIGPSGTQAYMIHGIMDVFLLPARLIAAMFVSELSWFPTGTWTTYYKLGMLLGGISGVVLIIKKLLN